MTARGVLDDYPWAGLLLVPISGAALAWVILSIIWPSTPVGRSSADPEVRLCDVAVEALLHSKDLTEITRAGIIVREIPCGVGRRVHD